MICTLLPGASSHLWPPHVLDGTWRERLEDKLVRAALSWLRQRGAKLAQAILSPAEDAHARPLPRNGLPHTTQLLYLRHILRDTPSVRQPQGLTYEAYSPDRPDEFHRTLLRTYDGTLDCPELDGSREVEEIVLGHQAQGHFDPGRWWLARRGGVPVAVLLLNDLPEWQGWEVAYIGVVPEARRHGVGRALACKALAEAKTARQQALILAVDRRNRPAWQLYREMKFEPFDRREVYLRIFRPDQR
jgi:ribosomal protein S18 acetylase RimI-like enzyme